MQTFPISIVGRIPDLPLLEPELPWAGLCLVILKWDTSSEVSPAKNMSLVLGTLCTAKPPTKANVPHIDVFMLIKILISISMSH